jgi:YD repeat-containing protein
MSPSRRILTLAVVFFAGTAFAQTGSSNIVYNYTYDNNNNLIQATDALGRITKQSYDALNRRTTLTDPNNGITQDGYDALDHLISVTDPRNLVTGYQIDGLGNLNQLNNPAAFGVPHNALFQRDRNRKSGLHGGLCLAPKPRRLRNITILRY